MGSVDQALGEGACLRVPLVGAIRSARSKSVSIRTWSSSARGAGPKASRRAFRRRSSWSGLMPGGYALEPSLGVPRPSWSARRSSSGEVGQPKGLERRQTFTQVFTSLSIHRRRPSRPRGFRCPARGTSWRSRGSPNHSPAFISSGCCIFSTHRLLYRFRRIAAFDRSLFPKSLRNRFICHLLRACLPSKLPAHCRVKNRPGPALAPRLRGSPIPRLCRDLTQAPQALLSVSFDRRGEPPLVSELVGSLLGHARGVRRSP
jgi:hypothetical protein